MKRIYLIGAAALMAVVGCNKEIAENVQPAGNVILTATVENDDTKLGAEVDKEAKTVSFSWTKGDAVAVQTAAGFSQFTLTGEGGTPNAEFAGDATPLEGGLAVFPANVAGSFDSGVLTLNLPAEYNYSAGQTNALLLASVAEGKAHFKHLAGIVSVQLKGIPAGAEFTLTSDGNKIAGLYEVDCTAEVPQIALTATENKDESTVAVKFAEAVADAVVYVPLPVGEYESLTASVVGSDASVLYSITTTETKSLGRKVLKAMPQIVIDLNEWFVTPEGAGDKSGSSWENAMGVSELRELIAQPVDADGAQIDDEAFDMADELDCASFYMAAGDYYLAGAAGEKVKVEFSGYDYQVEMYFIGGYPAGLTGTSKEGRDVNANVTAFTGNNEAGIFHLGNQTDITFEGITFKNVSLDEDGGAILASAGESGNCSLYLYSCKIQDNTNVENRTGAGIFLKKAKAEIMDCNFSGNYARNGSSINCDDSEGSLTVIDCAFQDNSTYNTSGAVQNSGKPAVFENTVFSNNSADSWGGGAYHTSGEAVTTFKSCEFNGNYAEQGGGAVSIENAECTFTDCIFKENVANNHSTDDSGNVTAKPAGGAIILRKPESVCTINNCTFTANQAPKGQGGAIASVEQSATLTINAGTKFENNTSLFNGGAIYTLGGMAINGTSDSKVTFTGDKTLNVAQTKANGGAIYIGPDITASLSNVVFDGNEAGQEEGNKIYYSNGGAICVMAVTSFTADNCEFTACRGRNGGGVNLELGTSSVCKFTDCNFHHNILRSGADKTGTGGNFNGGAARLGTGKAEFENCIFADNHVNNASAILHMNSDGNSAVFTGCQFLRNSSRGRNIGIKMEKTGQKLYLNDCLFEGNNGPSRGIINPNNNTLLYMNDVTFKDNYTTDSGNSWGVNVHAGNALVCMNNVTSYDNYNTQAKESDSALPFNSDGGWLVVNSTIIDKTPILFRANGTRKATFCNNILINKMVPEKLFTLKSADIFNDYGHNVMSCSGNHDNAVLNETNLLSQSETTLGGSYSGQWTADPYYGVYAWTNALTGFTAATAEDVYTAITTYDETNSSITIEKENFGLDFYNWLKTIGAVTESGTTKTFNDGRGVVRTGTMWPGAYQAN